MKPLHGRWALVTGASSGIGEAFCRRLTAAGCHLVMVARREERLKALARELEAARGVSVRIEALDLIAPGAVERLEERVRAAGIEIDLLVNNAGFGLYGRAWEIAREREQAMLELDVRAVVALTRSFLPGMIARRRGWVIQVASVAAYQPTPGYAAYAGAKAFVLSYGEALAHELRGSGVRVCVLSPGITESEFFEVSGQRPGLYHRLTRMSADRAAAAGLRGVLRGRTSVLPGGLNKLGAFCTRLLPRRTQAAIVARLMGVTRPS
jgi:short-subunit dehydrogenase